MDDPTLLIHWLFSILALIVMGVRLLWRKIARQPFNTGDYLTMAACLCCMVRLALIHVVLTWGTNNVPAAVRKTKIFTDDEIYRREIGSKFAIANRVFYNSFLWLQKLVLLDVYRRLLLNLRYEKIIMISFLVVFFVTYVAVQVTTFSECKPFHLYWQVVPDPGSCAKAQLQLIVVGVLNIITDVFLLAVPIPLFFSLKTSWKRKLKLYVLFTLGIFIVAITVIRLPINATNKDSQVNRTTWASTELLTATIVVNAPTIYGLWNKKKQSSAYSNSQGTGLPTHSSRKNGTGVHTFNDGTRSQAFAMKSMNHDRDSSMGGIMQTQEVIVSEYVDPSKKGATVRTDEAEVASNSSQRGILRD
ncbi:hypothetical protein LCI18_003832 [Fusarium solani-melongenae]|uniref:Uncharacterized protein n=1 Tax=Fusarium solani subsp. cucurbitae TaxID=2747967 RepID=A0ACD3YVB5_FUSSC|nr:hypothetical protein LCI18_003832 [Fusarium solani-melongenae]